jgi:hypothetical protein
MIPIKIKMIAIKKKRMKITLDQFRAFFFDYGVLIFPFLCPYVV